MNKKYDTVSNFLEVLCKRKSADLPPEQSESVVRSFLEAFGKRVRARREKVNLSQKELAGCLGMTASAMSRYEAGSRTMQVSALPLISIYCGVQMRELFPEDESEQILDSFQYAVRITADRYRRKEKAQAARKQEHGDDSKRLKGHVYDVDGKEVFVPVNPPYAPEMSLREMYRSATMGTDAGPCSEAELCDFIRNTIPDSGCSVTDAGRLLKDVADVPGKKGLCDSVADYIVDEILINRITKRPDDDFLKRVYAYYSEAYRKYHDDE